MTGRAQSRSLALWCALLGATAAAAAGPEAWLEDATAAAGLEFVHVRAGETLYRLPEIMSGGGGWVDYDGDGDLDLYLVQGGGLAPEAPGAGNRLYRNDGSRFVDVTGRTGAGDRGYGMGLAVGDYDGDGDDDLYLTNVGPNALLENRGDGSFRDATAAAGVGHPGWGTSAAFVDHDLDGDLDLFVVNYIHWSPENEIECFSGGAGRDYCHPTNYNAAAADLLYENLGGGRFRDVSTAAGLDRAFGNGLGVTPGDFDGDGRPDLYVANDGNPNQLWINQGDGTFRDEALLAGCAVNLGGMSEAGMGVAAGDPDGDGDLDLFVTHLRDETNTFYRNDGGVFLDATAGGGLAAASLGRTGFGTAFADLDGDGRLDLFVANGRVVRSQTPLVPGDPFAEPNQIFRGDGSGRFTEITGAAGPWVENSRAAALGDFDGDGGVDLLVVNNGGPARLLRSPALDAWLRVEPLAAAGSAALGTRVRLRAGGGAAWGRVEGAGSYCAASAPWPAFALTATAAVEEVLILRPGGRGQRFGPVPSGRVLRIAPPRPPAP